MPYNGAGVYSPPGADFPAVTQTVISSTHYNNVVNDLATALSLALTRDGQATVTGNIPFGGFRATNVGITGIAGSVGTPAINVSDAGTGLYRSAASELAVTVAGTQRGRFDSTGLIVTGTVNASTSVVTPQLSSASGNLLIFAGGSGDLIISGGSGLVKPNGDNTTALGSVAFRWSQIVTPIIDSGTTGSLSLKTNNGTEQARVIHAATAVNYIGLVGAATGGSPVLKAGGSDAGVGLRITTDGTGNIDFSTSNTADLQFQILRTASANRNITVTGSNGGNPTIGVTAGNLAITPAVVMASTLSAVGITSTGDVLASAARLRMSEGASFAATSNLTLGTDGNLFQITGNTQINLISNVGWSTNSGLVHLVFGGTPTVKHNQAASGANRPILLQGAVDLVATTTTVLTLAFSTLSNLWFEIARKT